MTLHPSKITPTHFKLLVEPKAVEEKTSGGIFIPETKQDADKFAQTEGRIVAMSHLAFTYVTKDEWEGRKPKVGDLVMHVKYGGSRVKGRDGKEYVIIKDEDVYAIIEE